MGSGHSSSPAGTASAAVRGLQKFIRECTSCEYVASCATKVEMDFQRYVDGAKKLENIGIKTSPELYRLLNRDGTRGVNNKLRKANQKGLKSETLEAFMEYFGVYQTHASLG